MEALANMSMCITLMAMVRIPTFSAIETAVRAEGMVASVAAHGHAISVFFLCPCQCTPRTLDVQEVLGDVMNMVPNNTVSLLLRRETLLLFPHSLALCTLYECHEKSLV